MLTFELENGHEVFSKQPNKISRPVSFNLHFLVHFFAVVVAVDYNVILWPVTSQGSSKTK